MQVSSSHQMYVFLLCVLLGIACGIFFDFQRSIRKMFFAGFLRTTIEDLLFAFFSIAALILLGYRYNFGSMRYYQMLGCASGALFYAAFFSETVMKILKAVYSFTLKFCIKPISKLLKLILIPIKDGFNRTKKLVERTFALFQKMMKIAKNKIKRLKKRIKML